LLTFADLLAEVGHGEVAIVTFQRNSFSGVFLDGRSFASDTAKGSLVRNGQVSSRLSCDEWAERHRNDLVGRPVQDVRRAIDYPTTRVLGGPGGIITAELRSDRLNVVIEGGKPGGRRVIDVRCQ
jgi:hypothetical protein